MSAQNRTPIDFARLADALLQSADSWVSSWLPHGTERNGRWYVGDFDGGAGESANVNLRTGQWIDNAAPDVDKGGDLISLYARIRGLNMGQAARELMQDLGWLRPDQQAHAPTPPAARASPASPGAPEHGPQAAADATHAAREAYASKWVAVVPVPPHAPKPVFRWAFKDKRTNTLVQLDAVRTWAYRRDDVLLGYVARFERVNSEGEIVKDTLPLTWCRDTTDDRGGHRWHWKQWEPARPLYLAAGTLRPELPVVVVEGEKCAQAGHLLLGDEFDFVAWPGGCKTWKLADWSWLAGRTVTAWPDADAQRERLTPQERQTDIDPATKPLRPLDKQPGWQAMQGIAGTLQADHGCTVSVCHPGPPGERPDGWDIADAIAEGWTADQVRAFIAMALHFQPPAAAESAAAPRTAGAGPGKDRAPTLWQDMLLRSSSGAIKAVRENVVLAIDGQDRDGQWIPGDAAVAGAIRFTEFTNDVVKVREVPWGTGAGVWEEVDELEMGNWLSRVHGLPSMPRGTLEEAVAMVAKRHRFHPVRAEFEALRGKWDGIPRLGTWLRICCLEEDEWDDTTPLQQYLSKVGTWMLMAIVARVFTPGCKFDYMPILEGDQGLGKSTLARVLGGEHFADTGLVLGDKDSYQNLQGVSVYEWGELDSLTKAEVTKVKQFISSMKDRFRASFDRRPKDYPRQCVFIGTTNEDHYLVDPTGNRRFWPIRVTRQIDIAWLRENRAQLFAEAVHRVDAGERFHPTFQEQKALFDDQQQQRQIESAIQAAVLRYLYDENAKFTGAADNGTLVNDISAPELLGRVGISVDKQTHQLLRQATAALRKAGWERYRSTRGDRPWMFKRPAGEAGRAAVGINKPVAGAHAAPAGASTSTAAAQQPMEEGAYDDIPF